MSAPASAVLQACTELHVQAVAEHNRGHPLRALRLLTRAETVLAGELGVDQEQSAGLAAAIAISIAINTAEVHGVERGRRALDHAHLLAERTGDPALLVRVHSQHAAIATRSGNFDVALAQFAAAEAMIEHSDRNDHFAILLNSGNLRLFRGELGPAREALSKAASFADEQQMDGERFKALHNLGYLEFLAGDLPRALRFMDQAGALATDVSPGIALLDRARVLAEAGLIRAADAALAAAADIFQGERLAQDLGETELERARCALIAGEPAAARRYAARARDRFRRRGNDRWRRSAELLLLQADLAAGRPGGRLVRPALRLAAELKADGLRLPARTAALIAADALLAADRPGQAAGLLLDLGRARRHDPITARLHARAVRARLEIARGNRAAGSRQARAGLAELADYQARFASIDLQTASAVHGRRVAELDISIALDSARPESVFAAAERARAVSSRLPVVRPPADPLAGELLAELRQCVESLRAAAHDRVAVPALLRRRRELEHEITARGWTAAGSGDLRRIADHEEVRAAVAASDTTMVTFVQSAGMIHAVVLGRSVRQYELVQADWVAACLRRTRADLDALAQPLLASGLRGAVLASFRRSVAELDSALLAPLGLDGRRLALIRTGVLGHVPWGELPSLRGVPVVVAQSATAWLRAAQPEDRSRRHRVVALAGPGVPRGNHEVSTVRSAWPTAQVLTGAMADRSALARALGRASIVHVAAHGIHQSENPMFSSLGLADGSMFAHELDQNARTADHVILSACELGLATVRPGDESLGLTAVLLRLGTRSVTAGVARVGDDVAAELMSSYHGRLAAGVDSAAALAVAAEQIAVPTPFVCFGAAYSVRTRPG
ncbi:MAG: CHAT domain-containing protein [Jatrophihabitans sp.]